MNKIVFKYLGKVMMMYSFLLFLPALVSLVYNEALLVFVFPAIISFIIGYFLNRIRCKDKILFSKDGFMIVTLSWIMISLVGALPLVLSVNGLSFVDALFESVSGFTTTGATVFKDVEVLDKSILFWRSFMHFIGGMGILSFVIAIAPLSRNDKSMYVLKAEMPGPSVSKLVPSIKKTLFYLYAIYIGLTLLEFILLLIGQMPIFDSILISFGTAGTGGFSLLNSSLATYSTFSKWVVTIFMFLFGVNFNIYFLLLIKDFKSALKSEELRVYISIYILSVLFIVINTYSMFNSMSEAILEGAFHISSLFTSTGYSIGDINIYPTSCRILVLMLMIISACAGSTCGGFKISRLIITVKSIKRDIIKSIHPNSVEIVRFEGKKVTEEVMTSTRTFMLLYAILIIIILFVVGLDGFNFEQTINAVFCTFGNVGLCFDLSNFSEFSNLSKIFLSIGMLLGRLEIFPIIALIKGFNTK